MSKITCEIVQDLMPLYIDNVLSEESKKAVKEHISTCEKCQATLEDMDTNIDRLSELKDKDVTLFKKLKKGFKKKYIGKAIAVAVALVLIWFGLSLYLMSHVSPVWPKAGEDAIKEYVKVVSIEGELYLHQTDMFGRGDIVLTSMMVEDMENGRVNLYLGETGIHSLGLGGAWIENEKYQKILPEENEMEIKMINYCKPDGTVITTLWSEGEEVPVLK